MSSFLRRTSLVTKCLAAVVVLVVASGMSKPHRLHANEGKWGYASAWQGYGTGHGTVRTCNAYGPVVSFEEVDVEEYRQQFLTAWRQKAATDEPENAGCMMKRDGSQLTVRDYFQTREAALKSRRESMEKDRNDGEIVWLITF